MTHECPWTTPCAEACRMRTTHMQTMCKRMLDHQHATGAEKIPRWIRNRRESSLPRRVVLKVVPTLEVPPPPVAPAPMRTKKKSRLRGYDGLDEYILKHTPSRYVISVTELRARVLDDYGNVPERTFYRHINQLVAAKRLEVTACADLDEDNVPRRYVRIPAVLAAGRKTS